MREFFLTNAAYWIEEFHLDGLRLDATQAIFDASPEHIMTAIGKRVREAARGRKTIIVAENEPQLTKLVRPIENGGYGLDALWNDDFHHSAMVAMTGRNEAYYTDYLGKPQEFISMVKYGYLYQGQRYKWQKQRRGTPGLRSGAGEIRHVYSESRPDRQFRLGRTCAVHDQPRAAEGDDRAPAARAWNPHALSRAGVRLIQSVLLFCGPRA